MIRCCSNGPKNFRKFRRVKISFRFSSSKILCSEVLLIPCFICSTTLWVRRSTALCVSIDSGWLILRAAIYDIPTAIDVLSTGTYPRLPTSIKVRRDPRISCSYLLKNPYHRGGIPIELKLNKEEIPAVTEKLTKAIHVRFLSEKLPEQFTHVDICTSFPIMSILSHRVSWGNLKAHCGKAVCSNSHPPW